MKTTKLVIGILLIIISPFIVFQSMAAGIVNTIENKGGTSGSMGILIALAYLIAGIVYISTKGSKSLGGDIANTIILGLFGLVALVGANKNFTDLAIWITLGFIIGIGFLIWHILINKKQHKVDNQATNNNFINQPYQTQQNYNQMPSNNTQTSNNYPSRSQLRSQRHK